MMEAVRGAFGGAYHRSRTRASTRIAGTAGSFSVLLLLLLSPMTVGTSAQAQVLKAPYLGTTHHANYRYGSSCSTVSLAPKWRFNLTSGVGQGAAKGVIKGCTPGAYAEADGNFGAAIYLAAMSGSNNLYVNAAVVWNGTVTATDGGSTACPSTSGGVGSTDVTTVAKAWDYNGGYFGNTSYQVNSSVNGQWTNYSNATSTPPSPFSLNATSLFRYTHSYGGSWACFAQSDIQSDAWAYLYDTNNGTTIPVTGNSFGGPHLQSASHVYTFGVYVDVYRSVNWGCYNSTYWNGPVGGWNNASLSCYHFNQSLTSIISASFGCINLTAGRGSAGASCGNATSGYWWWHYHFNSVHRYDLFLNVYSSAYADNTWPKGSATFAINAGFHSILNISSIVFS